MPFLLFLPRLFSLPIPLQKAFGTVAASSAQQYLLPQLRAPERAHGSCPFSLLNQEHQNIIYIGPYGTRSNQPIYLFQSMIGAVIS